MLAVAKIIETALVGLVDLARERREYSDRVFDHFVQPLYENLGAVHEDWLSALVSYNEALRLDNSDRGTSELARRVQWDALHTGHLRFRAGLLLEHEPPAAIAGFHAASAAYLSLGINRVWNDTFLEEQVRQNAVRTVIGECLLIDLHMRLKGKAALSAVDETLRDLQLRYSRVVDEYTKLRSRRAGVQTK